MTPLWDRVWSKVRFPEGTEDQVLNGCWLWTGAKSQKRRGQLRPVIQTAGRGSKIELVYRVVCRWYHGDPPDEDHAEAGHTCPDGENSLCVNPRHLRWMSREENEQWKWQHRSSLSRSSRSSQAPQASTTAT